MSVATVLPLVKDKLSSINTSDNYRGISLTSSLCKLLDYVIINRYGNELKSSDYQFAYESKCSTDMCSIMVKDVISFYNKNKSAVYACKLDASKAFDKVHFIKLFRKLLKRKVPALVLRLYLDLYLNQSVCVEWNGKKSRMFSVTNGVRQGSVLSGLFFNVYLDDLLIEVSNQNIGCTIANKRLNIFAYADDIIILTPNIRSLQSLVNICQTYASDHNITFNIKKDKSECIAFSSDVINPTIDIKLYDKPLEWKQSIVHLGHTLEHDLSNCASLKNACIDFMTRSNSILSKFRHCDPSIIVDLVKTYATTYFGSVTWKFSNSFADSLNNKFKTMMRVCCGLDNTTHSDLILCLTKSLPVDAIIYSRFVSFFSNMLHSDNSIVNFMSNISLRTSLTISGNNFAHITSAFCVRSSDSLTVNKIRERLLSHYKHKPETVAQAAVVREMYDCIGDDAIATIPGFSAEEEEIILKYVCCN